MADVYVKTATGQPVSGATVIISLAGAVVLGIGAGTVSGTTDVNGKWSVPNPDFFNAGGTADVYVQKIWGDGSKSYGNASWYINMFSGYSPEELEISLTSPQGQIFDQLQQTVKETSTQQAKGQTGLFGDLQTALETIIIAVIVIAIIYIFVVYLLPVLLASESLKKALK
jgi:hypothetical protein